MSTATVGQSSGTPFSPVQGDDQRHSTASQAQAQAQAHEQGRNPDTAPAPDEHPLDPKSRPNNAHNDHPATTPPPEAARRNADLSASGSGEEGGVSTGTGTGTGYPPQKHAGKAGLGPHYYEQHRATFQDKIHGLREELEGQIRHDEKLWQQGHERITGELKEKQRKEEDKSPFHKSANEDQKRRDKTAADKGQVPMEHKNKEYENKA